MLEHFTHKGDLKSPNIILDPAGVMEFQGRSLPENAKEIFTPVFEWMNNYSENPAQTTDINFKLEYFNTTSSKTSLNQGVSSKPSTLIVLYLSYSRNHSP